MLIIDGHNLTFADPQARELLVGGNPAASRERILRTVGALAAETGEKVTVVFDGTGGGPSERQTGRRHVRVAYAGADRTADFEILRMLRQSTGRRDVSVVTDDRSLGRAVRQLGAKVQRLEEFFKRVAQARRSREAAPPREPSAKRTGAPRDEVEYWLKFFRDEDDGGDRPES